MAKIFFENIKEEGLQWEGGVMLNPQKMDISTDNPLPAELKIEVNPVRDYYQLKGHIDAKLLLNCSRCLEDYTQKFDKNFEIYVVRAPLEGSKEEIELKKEDMAFSFNHGDSIDLDDMTTEQIILSLPMKVLCSEDCKGLCTNCGINKNLETCKCDDKTEDSEHPFAALKNLKKKSN